MRCCRDAATSKGFLTSATTQGSYWLCWRAGIQRSMSSERRGSFMTGRDVAANSRSRHCLIRLTADVLKRAASGLDTNPKTSSHLEPISRKSSSLSCATGPDSQKPVGLSAAGGMSVRGRPAPASDSTLVMAEVPLRCMPATSMAFPLPIEPPEAASLRSSVRFSGFDVKD